MKKPNFYYLPESSSIDYNVYDNFNELNTYVTNILNSIKTIKDIGKEDNLFVLGRGSSGITITTLLVYKLRDNGYSNASINVVRKPEETHHAYSSLSGIVYDSCDPRNENHKLIVVDDFMSSGTTIVEMIDTIMKYYSNDLKNIHLLCINNRLAQFNELVNQRSFVGENWKKIYSSFNNIICRL